nr:peptidoglycan DD-metalloendopeptidase family protein [Leucobacter weissii]
MAVAADGALYAPYDGVVVASGIVGDGVPEACVANPGWWRGPNHSVVMRHEFAGRVIFSSHNHIAPGSAVEPGVRVVAGQQVATSGMSGCTSGPHSHFTMATTQRIVNPDINPYDYLPGRAAE